MLCPKCGYITFDELPTCPKCKKDWTDIVGKVSGLGSMTEAPSFLTSVTHGQEDKDIAAASESTDALEANEEQAPESKGTTDDELTSGESPSEEGGPDLVLNELPALEVAETDSEIPEITIAPAPDKAPEGEEVGGIELNADLDLSLGDDDQSLPPALELDEKEEQRDMPTVDLDNIDLSDLMEPGTTEAEDTVVGGRGDDAEETGLEFTSPGGGQGVPDLLGIDLSLEGDEDGLDLFLEPETGLLSPEKKEDESAIPDLGLSLDLDD